MRHPVLWTWAFISLSAALSIPFQPQTLDPNFNASSPNLLPANGTDFALSSWPEVGYEQQIMGNYYMKLVQYLYVRPGRPSEQEVVDGIRGIIDVFERGLKIDGQPIHQRAGVDKFDLSFSEQPRLKGVLIARLLEVLAVDIAQWGPIELEALVGLEIPRKTLVARFSLSYDLSELVPDATSPLMLPGNQTDQTHLAKLSNDKARLGRFSAATPISAALPKSSM